MPAPFPAASRRIIASLSLSLLAACGGSSGGGSTPTVTIQRNTGYYDVVLDYTGRSHREVGKAYAEAIRTSVPGYETAVDTLIYLQLGIVNHYLEEGGLPTLTIAQLVGRAQAIFANVPQDYVDELRGMQEVFGYATDAPDGRLSANELLVLNLFPDVLRPFSCSASAAFGAASATGKTILGRNLDWFTATAGDSAPLNAVHNFKNGSRSSVNLTLLGMISASSQFNARKVFGAVLDGNTSYPYPTDLTGTRSYVFDLRYAIEHLSTMREVAAHMLVGRYAFNHNVFIADENEAGVVENDMTMAGRGLRLAGSTFGPGEERAPWDNGLTLAVVNDFRLPNTTWVPDASNVLRWASFQGLYATAGISGGTQVDVATMKGIAGFYGYNGDDWTTGALFLSSPTGYTTMQSIILDTSTLGLWAHFSPGAPSPLTPTYVRVPHALESH
jgi:hypothetical protein